MILITVRTPHKQDFSVYNILLKSETTYKKISKFDFCHGKRYFSSVFCWNRKLNKYLHTQKIIMIKKNISVETRDMTQCYFQC